MDEYTVVLKSKEFRELIRFLKRAAIIGEDYLVKNDMWIPAHRLPAGKPGKHILQYQMIPNTFESNVYYIKKIKEIAKSLDEIKGKLGTITLTITEADITIEILDCIYVIGRRTDGEFPDENNNFSSIIDGKPWRQLTLQELGTIKSKGLVTIYSDDGDPVRVSKGHFKLNGIEQQKNPIKYDGNYVIIQLDDVTGVFYIYMIYEFFKSVSLYSYVRYQESGDRTFEEL